jgi:hypothetical protein
VSDQIEPDVPDLRSLLAEASRPFATVTVPLNQGLRAQIEAAEAELSRIAEDATPRRMGAASPLKEKAREVEELRERLAASALTFEFEAPTKGDIDGVRKAMGGRQDEDEFDLRLTAASCVRVKDAQGREFPDRLAWGDFKQLRDRLGEVLYEASIKDASDKVYRRDWSVPFSFAASHILGTAK